MNMKRAALVLGLFGSLAVSMPAMAQTVQSDAAKQQRAHEIARQMLPPDTADRMASRQNTGGFGGDLARLSFENVYMQLWTRPGLELKERSLITIAMLIAIGNEKELAGHFESGLRNGLTQQQLEEVIYQATAYVGFPRASSAMRVAGEAVARYQATRKP